MARTEGLRVTFDLLTMQVQCGATFTQFWRLYRWLFLY